MMNIVNGGAHADNPIDVQEFMIMPVSAESCADAIRMGSEVFQSLKKALKDAGHNTNVGDEGGFAPNLESTDAALGFVMKAIEQAGYKPAEDMVIALDAASTEFYRDGAYRLEGEGKTLDAAGMVRYYEDLVSRYPIVSIEDGMAEDDWDGWAALTEALGGRIQLVGDDLFVTNPKRLADGIDRKIANSILVKVNQIGTLTETLEAVDMAHRAGLHCRDVASLGRDRRLDHRRPGGRHELRSDQDGIAVTLRQACQVQPANPHRGDAGRIRSLPGAAGLEGARSLAGLTVRAQSLDAAGSFQDPAAIMSGAA